MNAKEIRKLSDEDITIEVGNLRRRLFDLRTQSVTEKIQDTSQFAVIRKDIARLLTEQHQRATKVAS